jgi:hypothetical protein
MNLVLLVCTKDNLVCTGYVPSKGDILIVHDVGDPNQNLLHSNQLVIPQHHQSELLGDMNG